jgi:glycosyltransferase involved in cell wall biosynthesis
MKLIVQIPALNEADTIGGVVRDIPRAIDGVDSVEVLIIDDGCTDDTVAVALANGANWVVRHTGRKGLARAFQTGIDAALRLGADIIVNTDGDHQYPGSAIPNLIAPILSGEAEVVIGDRQISSVEHFSPLKKALQRVGSGVVRWASATDVPDTVSGFRALTREAALRLFVTTDFSYTVENLIQAGKKGLTITTVPIAINPVERPSRLHRGNWNFIKSQAAIIARTYTTYEPLKTFSYIALVFFVPGALLLSWALIVFVGRRLGMLQATNDQSLIVGGVLMIMTLLTFLFGMIADRIGGVRRLDEEQLYRLRASEVAEEEWRRLVSARLDAIERKIEASKVGEQAIERS